MFREKIDALWAKAKGAYKSVTVWINGLLLAALPFVDQIKEVIPQFENYLDEHIYKNVMVVIIAVNLVLRFKTKKALEDK